MKNPSMLLTLLISCSILLSLTGCDLFGWGTGDENNSPGTPSVPWMEEDVQQINSLLTSAGVSESLAEDKDEIISTEEDVVDGNRYAYETHDVVDNISSITHLGLNDDVIWPGAIIRGEQVHNFVYSPITLGRAPLTISSSLPSSQGWETVESPSLSSMRQAVTTLISRATDEDSLAPARVEFNISQVHSESDFALHLGAGLSTVSVDFSGSFDWNSTTKKNKIVASYKQVYYTIDVDTPEKPADFFTLENSLTDLESALYSDSHPMYVSSVSYGMMAFICIETDYSLEEMKSAIDASYDNGTVEAEVDFDLETTEMLESSNMNIVVYGGSSNGLDSISNGLDGFLEIINASNSFSAETPGVPLIYRFRHLSDNTLAEVTFTSQYTLSRFLSQVSQTFSVTCNRFVANWTDDEGTDNDVEMDRLYAWVTAWNCSAPNVKADPVALGKTEIVGYSDAGDGWVTGGGGIKTFNSTVNFSLNVEDYDLNNAIVLLDIYGRDYDGWTGTDETGSGSVQLTGATLLGDHTVNMSCADFSIDCFFTIALVD